MRLPSVCGGALLLLAAGCGSQQATPPAAQTQSVESESTVYEQAVLPLVYRGRQDPQTAYVAIVLGPKGNTPCAATIVPDTLKIPHPNKPGPKKLRVEWEVVNYCWSAPASHEVKLQFLSQPPESLPNPIQWIKEIAEMPSPQPIKPGFENRDNIRGKVNAAVIPNDPPEGRMSRTYNYLVKLTINGNESTVVDPELEVEY